MGALDAPVQGASFCVERIKLALMALESAHKFSDTDPSRLA